MLYLIRSGKAATRSDLRRLTGMSRTAVVSRVNALVDAGLVVNGDQVSSTGGRPPGGLVFNQHAGVVLAVAIGRSRSQVGVFDLSGGPLGASSVEHEVKAGPAEVMPPVIAAIEGLLGSAEREPAPVLGVGVSLPGTIDPRRHVCVDSPVMSGWDHVDLAPYFLAVAADAPLLLGNDADVLARSEGVGAETRLDDLLVVKASTGLGLGIVAGGRVVSGHLGAAGEIGHTKVDGAEGMDCRCGDRGCLEAVAGGWAIARSMAEQGWEVSHIRDVVGLATSGDREAKARLREAGRRLGEVLAVVINVLNPVGVVLGGDMGVAFDVLSAGVKESVYARSSALATRDLLFLPSRYGDQGGLVGCAAIALDEVLSPSSVNRLLAPSEV